MNVFRNEQEGRLRALWRLVFQYMIFTSGALILGGLAVGLLVAFAGGGSVEALTVSPAVLTISFAASMVAAVLSVWFAGRFLDHRPFFSGFGLRPDGGWWLDFGFGLTLGALLMAGIFVVELAAGWVTVTGAFEATLGNISFLPAILLPLAVFVCIGFYEELVFRGYQLKNIAEGLNFPGVGPRGAVLLAWAISSVLFALPHLGNPNASLASTGALVFAGLMLGVGYVLTGRLAIPIGLHITWNFFQGNVFGFPVSGLNPLGATFISVEQGGPPAITGGAFGPEAGLLGLLATVVGSLLTLLWVRARSGKASLMTSLTEPPPSATTNRAHGTPGG